MKTKTKKKESPPYVRLKKKPDISGAEWKTVEEVLREPPKASQLDRIEQKLDQLLARPYWYPYTPPPLPQPWKPTELRTPTDPWGNPTIY
jgi:hypothetical protein